MTNIYLNTQSIKKPLSGTFQNSFKYISDWMGRAVQLLKTLPEQMQKDPNTALAVFITANSLFFIFTNSIANALQKRVDDAPQEHDAGEKRFNRILIDGLFVGTSFLTFNVLLSKLTRYSLSYSMLTAITVTAIFFRSLLHAETEPEQEEIILEEVVKTPQSPIKKDEVEKVQPKEEVKVENKDQQAFIDQFCENIHTILDTEYQYVNFNAEQKAARAVFLTQLNDEVASIEDQADICRAVNVPIQAAFEEVLCKKLLDDEVTDVRALFLTGLPCTPLRTPRQEIDVTQEAEWKKWTVDMRTETVRALRDANAQIVISYSAADYQALPDQSAKGKAEFDTYEEEKNHENILDIPLSITVPKDLIGALYSFKDKKGNGYILATQGIQIQHHGEAAKECWKIWFGSDNASEANDRAKAMLDFIVKDKPEQANQLGTR